MKTYLLPSLRNKSRKNLSPEARDTWYANVYENGRIISYSLKTTNKKIAMDWFAKMQASRYAPKEPETCKVSVEEAAERFLAEIENVRHRAGGTARVYRMAATILLRHCQKANIIDMADLTPQKCSDFVSAAFAGYAAHTAKSRLVIYRSFWNWAAERYSLPGKNPFKGIAVQKPKPAPRKFWTVEECEKIIAAAESEEMKCYFALMAFAGLRREEARHIRLGDIKDGKISLVGKGGKYAQIPISSRLGQHLNRYLTSEGISWLPPGSNGPLFPRLSALVKIREYWIMKAAEKAGLEADEAHYHRFRHSFASNLLRMGRSIKAVQMLMRHENVTLTLNIYGHLLPSDLDKEVEL
jgi:site-specific recombinase XerD